MKRVPVAITMGDPSGIGPEIIVKSLKNLSRMTDAAFFIIGDGFVLRRLGFKESAHVSLIDLGGVKSRYFKAGVSTRANGVASLVYLKKAVALIKKGTARALVTAPIAKESLARAGFRWPGHTEFLAHSFGVRHVEMVFVSKKLKVVIATRHMALKDVMKNISQARIIECGTLMAALLKNNFNINNPRVAVCGLNPHAGESGLFGKEEELFIKPAVMALNKKTGCHFYGPLAADTVFKKAHKGNFDLVIAMYHDQGLIPFKLVAFEEGVNLTAGLPFVRTSPVHGTAFDIAGHGCADPNSFVSAARLAVTLTKNFSPHDQRS